MSSDFKYDSLEVAGSGERFIGVAGEALANRQLVRFNVAGQLVRASAAAAGTLPCVGITLAAASAGQSVEVLIYGFLGLSTWTWSAGGARLFVSDTLGALAEVAGTVTQRIGVALSATQIFFDAQGIDTAGVLPGPHEWTHVQGGADDIDSALDARAIALANQGDIVYRAAVLNTLAALAPGVAGQFLRTAGAGANPAWATLPTQTGLQDVFYPAPDPDDFKGRHATMLQADGVSTLIRQEFYLPNNWTALWGVDVIVIPDGTGNLRWGVNTDFGAICSGEQYNANSDSIALGQAAVTNGEIECLDITAALTGAAAGDLVGIEFTRDGGNVLDTVNDEVHYVGVILRASAPV